MTVSYEGRERTMPEMSKYLELPDRTKREEAWRLTQGRMAKDSDQLDEIFDKMVGLRDRDSAGTPASRTTGTTPS